jgi:fibronectin type 3 domain-containing protein
MKISVFSLRRAAALVGFAAAAMLAGCAGVSTGGPESVPQASSHSVYLSWNPSTSPDVAGYNVYRAVYTNSCGSFSKINSELTLETTYADSAVANNASYCYTTTAVNAKKEESGFSEIIPNVQIPAE